MPAPFRVSKLEFTPTPSPAWADVVYAESIGVWLAVAPQGAGSADTVLRSVDGLVWTEETLPVAAAWNSIVWSEEAGLFAIFNNNNANSILSSPDGITWTVRHAQQSLVHSCVYAQSKFVGVGGQKRNISANVFSKANFALAGVGVSSRTVNINMSVSRSMFVGIVGNTSDNVTGVTFNSVAMTLLQKVQVSGDRWIYLFHLLNPSLGGTFALTVSFSATNQGSAIYISGFSNGADVTSSTTNTGSGTAISTSRTTTEYGEWLVQFSCNAADSAGTAGTDTSVRQTSDGQGGTMADSNGNNLPIGTYSINVNVTSSQWAAITAAFRPLHEDGLVTSSDGLTWTESYLANETMQGVAYSPELDLFCAVTAGSSYGPSSSHNILTSPDGTTWTYRDLGNAQGASLSATGNSVIVWADELGLFVVVIETGQVYTSPDGETWTEVTLPVDAAFPTILGVTWANVIGGSMLIFMAEADSAGLKPLAYSEDGVTIVPVPFLSTDDFSGDWRSGVYVIGYDRMVVFPRFSAYAMLVEFGPDLIEIDADNGEIVGGNTVNLIGTGFVDGMEVVFDNRYATDVNVVSETLATCVVPAHASGFVNVTVTNPDTRYDEEPLFYEYHEPIDPETGLPEIIPGISWLGSGCSPGSIVPDHGTMAGGTVVTIHGQGFRAGSLVYFDGILASDIFVDATQPWLALVEAKNPEAWWRLEEESAALVLLDETANGHDATMSTADGKTSVQGGLSYSASKGVELSGGSRGFSFDGSQDIASFADLGLLGGACTIEFFYTVQAQGVNTYGTVIGATVDQDGIYVFDDGADIFMSYESAAHGYADQTNTTPLVPGTTYHVALVFDGLGAAEWFIDGVADGAVADVNLAGVLDCIFDTGGFQLVCPMIDEIAVYDVALDAATLLNHSDNRDANYPALVLADGAVAYWRCEEDDAATTIVDSTGNGNDASTTAVGRTSVAGALDDGHVHAVINPGVSISGNYSIEFLINPFDNAALQAILVNIATLGFLLDPDLTLRAEVAHAVLSDTPLVAGAISHVVFTADGSTGRWYIDGVAHGSGTWDNTDDATLFRLFAGTVGGDPLVCNLIDEIVVHSVTLSPSDVVAHFEAAREWVSGTYITCVTPPHQTGPVDVEVISP